MSIKVEKSEIRDPKMLDIISSDLRVIITKKFSSIPDMISLLILENNYIKVPFNYGVKIGLKRPPRESYPKMSIKFQGELREEQVILQKETIDSLNKSGSVIVNAYCGFGKTCCSIDTACTIKLKTLIIVNKVILMKQWEESIKKFCPDAKILQLKPKVKFDTSCDFYIINAANLIKFINEPLKIIGTVIVDEAHLIMAATLSRTLQYLFPRYLIGLTATPYRVDSLDILLQMYFGTREIIRKLYRDHRVFVVNTGFVPEIVKGENGKMNWNKVLDSQAYDTDRNELIIKIILKYSERVFLVPVKRVKQGEYLFNRLRELGENVTSLLGSNQEFDKESRILVATLQKCGVGFDHPRLNTLLLGADTEEYFIQYLGRVFRTKNDIPIIFDLVDDNGVLKRHYTKTRREIYKQHGGKIFSLDPSTI
jgi:superfamily II DNA or RNA helicase